MQKHRIGLYAVDITKYMKRWVFTKERGIFRLHFWRQMVQGQAAPLVQRVRTGRGTAAGVCGRTAFKRVLSVRQEATEGFRAKLAL